MFYGNPSCDDQQFSERVWDQGYCGVWHMDNFRDSTLNNNDGSNHGTDDTSGKIGKSRDFNRQHLDYISWGDMSEPANNNINKATFQAWYNPDDMEKSSPMFLKYNTGKEPDDMSYSFRVRKDGHITFRAGSGSWSPSKDVIDVISDDSVVTIDNWNHIVAVIDLSTRYMEFYHNGVLIDNSIIIEGSPPSFFHNVACNEESGRQIWESTNTYLDGQIDEIRISKVLRSEDWITTEYNNQINPMGFYSVGPEE
jgi:hypothetical protein